jgi:hypothetical protein
VMGNGTIRLGQSTQALPAARRAADPSSSLECLQRFA